MLAHAFSSAQSHLHPWLPRRSRDAENYGSGSEASSGCADLSAPLAQMRAEPSILMVGGIVSLFEGSMYIFVFNWTPALSGSTTDAPPFGLIFSAFMVACMGGSSLFAILSASVPCETLLKYVFVTAAGALTMPLVAGSSTVAVLAAFLLFEACVGMYWPAIGTLKSMVVPENTRATIYNLYRVPLNAIVLGVLLNHISTSTALSACAVMLLVAFALQQKLVHKIAARKGRAISELDEDEEYGGKSDHKASLLSGSY